MDRLKALRGHVQSRRVEIDGHQFTIPPGVLDPRLFRSGEVLARYFQTKVHARQTVLDLGCGSGVVGVLAQSRGAEVTGSDIDHRACSSARANGLKDVRQADLFDALEGQLFDHIVFNPPYFDGDPDTHPLGQALYGEPDLGVLRRYLCQVSGFLSSEGLAWIILSDLEPRAAALLDSAWTMQAEFKVESERLSIFSRGR